MPVANFMTANVKTVTEDETIQTVCKLMDENDVGSIVVVRRIIDGINPVGIITEKDIIHQIASSELFTIQAPIRQIMSTPLITIESNSHIREAIQTMQLKNIRRLPVIDEKRNMIGIISEKDVLKAI